MAENSVFMDTNVFSNIVDGIRGTASECVFSDSALKQADRLDTYKAGRKIHELLLAIHKTDELYRQESSQSLPHGFLTMRDSMIAIDKACAESLTVENVRVGGGKK
mgnify:CR=1 FL=1